MTVMMRFVRMTPLKRMRWTLCTVIQLAVVGFAFAQGTIQADRGTGAEYAVGDAIELTYSVSQAGVVEVMSVSPTGEEIRIDRRSAEAGRTYTLRGVVEEPVGVAVFELRTSSEASSVPLASTFIRVISGESPWAWLERADVARARIVSREVVYRARDDRMLWGIYTSAGGGFFIVEASGIDCLSEGRWVAAIGAGVYSRVFGDYRVSYVDPDGRVAEILTNDTPHFASSPFTPNRVFFFTGPGNTLDLYELDLVTGDRRKLGSSLVGSNQVGICMGSEASALTVLDGETLASAWAREVSIHSADVFSEPTRIFLDGRVSAGDFRFVAPAPPGSQAQALTCHSECALVARGEVLRQLAQAGGQSRALGPALAPAGPVYAGVSRDSNLWLINASTGAQANIGEARGKAPVVAWDQREPVIYWTHDNVVYRGVVSAPIGTSTGPTPGQGASSGSAGAIDPDRPRLGIAMRAVAGFPEALREGLEWPESGQVVVEVARGGAAEAAGIVGPSVTVLVDGESYPAGGDVIVAADGRPVPLSEDLQGIVFSKQAGDVVVLDVWRNGRLRRVEVTLAVVPAGN